MIDTICYVWSFRDENAEIPYRIDLIVKKQKCTCPAYSYRGTCKHLITLRNGSKDGSIMSNDKFQFTDFGKEYLSRK